MEKFSSNLVLYCSCTPNWKYENNEQELMGEERRGKHWTQVSSRWGHYWSREAPELCCRLWGSVFPELAAGHGLPGTAWRTLPQPGQSWLCPRGRASGAAAWLGFGKPQLSLSGFEKPFFIPRLLAPSLYFLPFFPLSRWGNSPPQASLCWWNCPLQHSWDTCKTLMK